MSTSRRRRHPQSDIPSSFYAKVPGHVRQAASRMRASQVGFNEGQTWWRASLFHLENYILEKSSFHQGESDPALAVRKAVLFCTPPPPASLSALEEATPVFSRV